MSKKYPNCPEAMDAASRGASVVTRKLLIKIQELEAELSINNKISNSYIEQIKELERQLFEQQEKSYNKEEDLLCEVEDLQAKLAESVPKSEIKTLLRQARDVSSWVSNNDAYKHLRDELKQLLTPPAKEDE